MALISSSSALQTPILALFENRSRPIQIFEILDLNYICSCHYELTQSGVTLMCIKMHALDCNVVQVTNLDPFYSTAKDRSYMVY